MQRCNEKYYDFQFIIKLKYLNLVLSIFIEIELRFFIIANLNSKGPTKKKPFFN